jgi:hypothetical protein
MPLALAQFLKFLVNECFLNNREETSEIDVAGGFYVLFGSGMIFFSNVLK